MPALPFAAVMTCTVLAGASPQLPAPSVIARTGDDAVGFPIPSSFMDVQRASINAKGDVLFGGGLGDGVAFPSGFWLHTAGVGLAPIVFSDMAAPDLPGLTFADPCIGCANSAPMLNDAGRVFFEAVLEGPGVTSQNSVALFTGTPGNLSLVLREGDVPPGFPDGSEFEGTGSPFGLNNTGSVAFVGVTGPSPLQSAIFAGGPGALAAVVKEGQPAAGVAGSAFVSFGSLGFNDGGMVAFEGEVEGATEASGVWAGTPEKLVLAAQTGKLAPGTFVTFNPNMSDGFDRILLNETGEVAFRGFLNAASDADTGLWAGRPEDVRLIARQGDMAPGPDGPGVLLDLSHAHLADNGFLAFNGFIDPGTGNTTPVVYRTRPAEPLEIVAARNTPVPDGSGAHIQTPDRPLINAVGQVAFLSSLAGPGVTPANDRALFLTDTDGTLFQLAREGDLFEVAPGEFLPIVSFQALVSTLQSQDLARTAINDQGQLVATLLFPNRSAVVVFSIPAPPAAAALVLLGLTVPRRRGS